MRFHLILFIFVFLSMSECQSEIEGTEEEFPESLVANRTSYLANNITRIERSAQNFFPFSPGAAFTSTAKPKLSSATKKPVTVRTTKITRKPVRRTTARPTGRTTARGRSAAATVIQWRKFSDANGFWGLNCDFQGKSNEKTKVKAEDCIKECQNDQDCSHFTWAPPRGGTCWLKSGPITKQAAIFRQAPGLRCGYLETPVDETNFDIRFFNSINWRGKNWSFGCDFYASNFASIRTSSKDCEATCQKTAGCSHYVWVYQGATGSCGLKSGDVTKEDAFIIENKNVLCGVLDEEEEKEPEWHMIVGGKNENDLTSVEAFNWKTKEQCALNALPVGIRIHSATVLYGVPVVCGGFSYEIPLQSCFKYVEETGLWKPISQLLVATASGSASVQVPNKGWFIFGGEGNSLTRSQKLNHPDGKWELGPDLFLSRTVTGECLVQLNDTHTAFLGGSNNNHEILTFNWLTQSYTKHTEQLIGRRWKSACALMFNSNGDPLIAIAGGLHPDGKGLEIWSPTDATVKLASRLLPTETDKSFGLNHAQLIPIKRGSELLLYGGYQGQYQGEVWKFSEKDSSWTKHGDMLLAREEHTVLPISKIVCPGTERARTELLFF